MQDILFDHVFSVCRNNNLQKTLADLQSGGFTPDKDVTQHIFGNHSGFVLLSGTYLELLSFYDKDLWNSERDPDVATMVDACRPYGMGMRCEDSEALHDAVSKIFPDVEPCYSAGRKDSDDPRPIWKFFNFPKAALPGVSCFSVQYLRHPTSRSQLHYRVNPNSISGVTGFVFCTDQTDERIKVWHRTLSAFSKVERTPSGLQVGVQHFEWIHPVEYKRRFGTAWQPLSSSLGELAAVQLVCDDLATAITCLEKLPHSPKINRTSTSAFVPPDRNNGFAFQVTQFDSKQFFSQLQQLKVF